MMRFTKAILLSLLVHGSIFATMVWLSFTPNLGTSDDLVSIVVLSGGYDEPSGVSPSLATTSGGKTPTGDTPLSSASLPTSNFSDRAEKSAGGKNNPTLRAIRNKINRAKRYPSIAREQRLEGTTRVQFEINDAGDIADVTVIASSGSGVLDDAALATIKDAAPLPLYPFPITLGLRYSLED